MTIYAYQFGDRDTRHDRDAHSRLQLESSEAARNPPRRYLFTVGFSVRVHFRLLASTLVLLSFTRHLPRGRICVRAPACVRA